MIKKALATLHDLYVISTCDYVNTCLQKQHYICPTHDVILCACVCSAVSDTLWPQGLQPTSLPYPWTLPGKNTGMSYHFLLQGIFPTQRLNPLHLLCTPSFLRNPLLMDRRNPLLCDNPTSSFFISPITDFPPVLLFVLLYTIFSLKLEFSEVF